MSSAKRSIVYLGFNDPRRHLRGTENVIRAQAAATEGRHYYVFRSTSFEVFRWSGMVAVACPHNLLLAGLFLRRLVARIRHYKGVAPVLHGHSYLLSMVASGAPLLFTVHDALTYLKKNFGSRTLWPFRLIEAIVYRRAVRIHAISRFAWSQAAGRNAVIDSKVAFVYNTLPTTPRSTTTLDSETTGQNVTNRPINYLVVRSIEPRAGLDLIVALARQHLELSPGIAIKVVGKGPLLAHYQRIQAIEQLKNLMFLGYVSDDELDELYRRADCVIMPALYGEGFGLPLIEAYARGIAAVGSNVCAVPEVIQSPELLFENTLPSLQRALEKALATPSSVFTAHFESKFSLQRIRHKYQSIYASIL